MSGRRERYPFVIRDPAAGAASLAALLPLQLRLGATAVNVSALIDSGAAINVLPWSLGLQMGGDWDASTSVTLSGNLAAAEARVLVCEGVVGQFPPQRLAFAWTKLDTVPILLGHVNFLMVFDVLLSRTGGWFDIGLSGAWGP